MKNRVKIGNSSDSDLFISIHLNKIEQSKYYGWQTFYKKDSEEGKESDNEDKDSESDDSNETNGNSWAYIELIDLVSETQRIS